MLLHLIESLLEVFEDIDLFLLFHADLDGDQVTHALLFTLRDGVHVVVIEDKLQVVPDLGHVRHTSLLLLHLSHDGN